MPDLLTKQAPVQSPGSSLDGAGAGKPLLSAVRIARRVHRLGREISELYADIDTPLVMVVILKGATVFAADLLRSLSIPAELEFVRASSYPTGTSSNGRLKLAHMVEGPLVGRHVLLVEDIVDSGVTVNAIARRIRRLSPASLRIATLLDRPARRAVEVKIDFCGFVIPDRFVIGYGLDYAGLYRELPHIYSLT
jgi:hypoxanthine phosphoribosyltransferase